MSSMNNGVSFRAMVIGFGFGCLTLSSVIPVTAFGQNESTVVQVKRVVKTVPLEKAVATVSKTKVNHVSPTSNLLSILKNIPGFNILSAGPGNLIPSDNAFTLNGFTSSQVGSTFYGVPIINTFRGGIYGRGDDHAVTPMTTGQIGGVQVYSGANTPKRNSLDSLGGTINFSPKLPSNVASIDLNAGGGAYANYGSVTSEGIAANTGLVNSLAGFKALIKYERYNDTGFQKHVHANINSYYLAAIQPFNKGLSKITLIITKNNEKARTPNMIPLALINQFGRNYQYPSGVANNWFQSKSTHTIVGLKTMLNPFTVGELKFFYNETRNDRTAYANPLYNNSYLGYRLPTYLKSTYALDGYGSKFNVYNSLLATQLFGSAHAGTQYQRYIDNYHNVGGKTHLTFILPNNTVTVGGMILQAKDYSTEGWYGSSPVPLRMGYNNAWLEHDGKDYWDGYAQDNISFHNGLLHVYPGVKYVHISMYAADSPGYYYGHGGAVSQTWSWAEPSLGVTFSPIASIQLYTNYGRTDKAPNSSALYGVIGRTPIPPPVTVNPEYVDSLDAGIRYSSAFGKASLAVFDRRFSHMFSYSYNDVTGVTREYNSGTADYKGFTIVAQKPLFDYFMLEGNYGYTNAKYTSNFSGNNGAVTSGMRRPDVPEYTANLGLGYERGNWYGDLSSHFVGHQYLAYYSGVTSDTTIPAYETVDLKISYTWKMHQSIIKKIKLSGYIDNLLNQKYIAYASVHGSAGASGNYELVQEGMPQFTGITLAASFF